MYKPGDLLMVKTMFLTKFKIGDLFVVVERFPQHDGNLLTMKLCHLATGERIWVNPIFVDDPAVNFVLIKRNQIDTTAKKRK